MAFDQVGGNCVFTSEWDKFARLTYEANHPDAHDIRGDITQILAEDVPDHDVLVAGFPCQPFSLAGVSKKNSLGRAHGFLDETQGTLFFDIARILEAKRPRAFLLENVKNLRSHDNGKTYTVILNVLRKLGYSVYGKVIDAKCLVPQHRERIFIVGLLDDTGFAWDELGIPDVKDGPRLNKILHNADEKPDDTYTESYRGKTRVVPKYTLTDNLWNYLQAYAAKHKAKGNGFGFGLVGPNDVARTLSARYHKDGSEILVHQKGKNPRRLTPRECARLMGFPPSFLIPVSDTQAYRQFGNSVAMPVVRKIARGIATLLSQNATSAS
jgi:DNA (cytosine-5)-methyltransferase 1